MLGNVRYLIRMTDDTQGLRARAQDGHVAGQTSSSGDEPESAALWVPIGDVHPWADNPRHNEHAVERVAQSIRRFGWGAPIVARQQNGQIIAGHTRYQAAKQLGLTRVPVRFVNVDPSEAELMALADNRLGELADWDAPKLAEMLLDVSNLGDIEAMGWSEADLDVMRSFASSALDDDANDPEKHWGGMPEFESEDQSSWRKLIVHFANEDDLHDFERRLGQTITPKQKWTWHPVRETEPMGGVYDGDEE